MSPGSSEIMVRPAHADDLDVIAAFNSAMSMETENKELDDGIVREGVRSALADPARARYFVAERNGEIAGQTMVTLEWSDWRNGFFWWIQSVYVAPVHRRHGVFRALHAHVRKEALATPGTCGLRLYVHHSNQRAMSTYEGLGMHRTDYHLFEEEWTAPAPRIGEPQAFQLDRKSGDR